MVLVLDLKELKESKEIAPGRPSHKEGPFTKLAEIWDIVPCRRRDSRRWCINLLFLIAGIFFLQSKKRLML